MKNLFNLSIGFCLVMALFSCKKVDYDQLTTSSYSSNGTDFVQSARVPISKSIPGGGFSIGLLSEWLILGTQKTEVHLEEFMISNGGKIGSGPAGKFKLEHDAILNSNVFLHSGVKIIEIEGVINGSFNQNQNLAHLHALLNKLSDSAADFTPTVTLYDVNTSTTIVGNGTVNVINLHKLRLNYTEIFTLSGNSTELFIINIADGMELKGAASIITSGGALSKHVLINILGHDKKATSTSTGTINGTILAPDSKIEVSNVNGQIIGGGRQIMTVDSRIYNYIPFGS